SQYEGAADIRMIAFDGAAAVNQQNRSFLYFLRFDGAMRQRRIRADLHSGASFESELRVRVFDHPREILLRHSRLHGTPCGFVRLDRDRVGQLHQLDFVLSFVHAAACGDRSRARERHARRRVRHAVAFYEPNRLFDSDFSVGDSAVFQPLRHSLVGTLVLLPDAPVWISGERAALDLLSRAALLETRANEKRFAFGWQYQGECALA